MATGVTTTKLMSPDVDGAPASGKYDPILLKRSSVLTLKGTGLIMYARFVNPNTYAKIFDLTSGVLLQHTTLVDFFPQYVLASVWWPNAMGMTSLCDVFVGQSKTGYGYAYGYLSTVGASTRGTLWGAKVW